jgi:hypothetical protein
MMHGWRYVWSDGSATCHVHHQGPRFLILKRPDGDVDWLVRSSVLLDLILQSPAALLVHANCRTVHSPFVQRPLRSLPYIACTPILHSVKPLCNRLPSAIQALVAGHGLSRSMRTPTRLPERVCVLSVHPGLSKEVCNEDSGGEGEGERQGIRVRGSAVKVKVLRTT